MRENCIILEIIVNSNPQEAGLLSQTKVFGLRQPRTSLSIIFNRREKTLDIISRFFALGQNPWTEYQGF